MSPEYLWYQVRPTRELPAGMAGQTLAVLSPVWQGPEMTVVFPDGWQMTLRGRTATGQPCHLRVFWTEAAVGEPPVCLAIGGEGGLHCQEQPEGSPPEQARVSVRPLLALATSLIPQRVRGVIGPEPPKTPRLLL